MKAIHLQTEYLKEPLGLGISAPRFYWNCEGGITQTAYKIVAKREGGDNVWLAVEWQGEKPVIKWHDEWRIEDYK